MKNTITILALLITLVGYSQRKITFNATQDARLLIVGDDKGNDPLTLDLAMAVELQGLQYNAGYVVVRPEFEYAELQGGIYKRYSGNVGYSFNKWVKDFTFTATIGHGFVNYNGAFLSFGNNLQLTYNLNDNIGLFLDLETVERKDLLRYESTNRILGTAFRTSGKIGIKIAIFRPK